MSEIKVETVMVPVRKSFTFKVEPEHFEFFGQGGVRVARWELNVETGEFKVEFVVREKGSECQY